MKKRVSLNIFAILMTALLVFSGVGWAAPAPVTAPIGDIPAYVEAKGILVGDANRDGKIYCLCATLCRPLAHMVTVQGNDLRPQTLSVVVPSTIRVLMTDGSVKEMDMEEYLRGVVPAEMGPEWVRNKGLNRAQTLEALKAQAVAARSYAAARVLGIMWNPHAGIADVCTKTCCQVWSPATHPLSDEAITATRNVVATYNGQIIQAFYFAHCDGHTRNSEDVWVTPLPYCRSVSCDCNRTFLRGHGVGMCQWGAVAMAKQDYCYVAILKHYYTGIEIVAGQPSEPVNQPTVDNPRWTGNFYDDTVQMILARAIFGEARGEIDKGKIAVGWVIRNRAENPRWWGSGYHGVILHPWQFSSFNEGDPNRPFVEDPLHTGSIVDKIAWQNSYEIAGKILENKVPDPTFRADHFYSIFISPPWWADPAKFTVQIGNHRFYRLELSPPGGVVVVPTVETRPATSITETSAVLNARIVDDGGGPILERRFEWGVAPHWDYWTADVDVSGDFFSYRLTGLTPGTTYNFRAWARNAAGWTMANTLTFTTAA
ncbi:SpoIID/LytB domain-containing protein, partial [Dehalococcoidia bacterium]|nr:SpoIID/LytB domain-containing protein [Dehalococcoidia bacterium]